MPKRTVTRVKVGKRTLDLSNLEKVFYPKSGFTKGQVIDYYQRIAPVLLPHLKNRPLTLKRYPNGVKGLFFYEKRCPAHRPEWVTTASVWSEGSQSMINFCVVNDLPTLAWAANLAVVELHAYLHTSRDIMRPTFLALDLDPGPPAGILECARVAMLVRDELGEMGLECYAKTSGSKGLQVYIPLNTATTYDATKPFARGLAAKLQRANPKLVVSNMRKDLRKGKVLIDWSQNDDHKTTVCVYSLRAKEEPTVSTPIKWDEVEQARMRQCCRSITQRFSSASRSMAICSTSC